MSRKANAEKLDGRRVRGDRARAAILKRALEIASVDGLDGLTFSKLAAETGMSKANVTVLFGDKLSLQRATMAAYVQRVIDLIVEPAYSEKTPLRRLRALNERWFQTLKDHALPGGCLMYATAHEYRARPGVLRDEAVMNMERWQEAIRRQIRAGQESGDIDPSCDPVHVATTLDAYQNAAHLAINISDGARFDELERLSRQLIDSLEHR